MKNTPELSLLFLLFFIIFGSKLNSQIIGFSECLDQNDAFIGLDRKGWTSNIDDVSESYQFDFQMPDPGPFDCHKISYISVSVSVDVNFNNIMPTDCYIGFWSHSLYCDSNDPISCDDNTILTDQSGLNTSYNIVSENNENDITIENGGSIGIDIVVLTVAQNPDCPQTPITSGLYEADVEVCIDVYYEALEPEMEVDLGDDIIICDGATIDLEAPDGFEEYEWDGPIDSDEQTLEDAIPGVYVLDAYDELGCKSSDEIEILVANDIDIQLNGGNPLEICNDTSTSLSPFVNNIANNPDFNYSWMLPDGSSSTTSTIDINQIGTYILQVEDEDSGCTKTANLVVTESNIAIAQIDSLSFDNINLCSGDSQVLTAFVSYLDNNNYAFEWVNGTDTTRIQNLTINQGGTYILNMYNQIGCPPSSDTLIVNEIIPLSAGLGNSTTICVGEVIDLNSLLSMDADNSGNWFDENNNAIIDGIYSNDNGNTIQNLTYVVTNPLPCSNDIASFSVFINEGTVDAGNDYADEICFGTNFDLSNFVDGDIGGDYFNNVFELLLDTEIVSSDIPVGQNLYYYIVQGGNCGIDTAILNINVLPEINPTLIEGPICLNEDIDIGGEIFNANNPIGTINLTSSTNCDSTININLSIFPEADTLFDEIYCSSESVNIGGEIFDINNTSNIITLPNASINGCDSIINVDLTFLDAISEDIILELCEGDSLIVDGTIYNEANPMDMITIPNGSSLGCDSIINIDLSFSSSITENFTTILCDGESIEINGIEYTSTNNSGQQEFTSVMGCDSILDIQIEFLNNSDSLIILDLCEDEEIVINGEIFNSSNTSGTQNLINEFGCDSLITIAININPTTSNEITETLCADDSIIVDGEIFDINNPNGIVTLENSSSLSCDSIVEIDLTFIEEVMTNLELSLCMGDSIFIDNQWIFDQGTYVENNTSSNGCDSIVNYNVEFNNCNIDLDFQLIAGVSCHNGDDASVNIELIGMLNLPYNYEVLDILSGNVFTTGEANSSNVSIVNLMPSEYTFNLLNPLGEVISSSNFTIDNIDPVIVNIVQQDIPCPGDSDGSITLEVNGGTSPYAYEWSNNSTSSTIDALDAGNYSFTVTDANSCSQEGSIDIISPDEIDALLLVTNADCETESNGVIAVTDISGGTPAYSYSIDAYNFSDNNEFQNLSSGNYQVLVSDMNGCIQSFDANVGINSTSFIDEVNDLFIDQGDSISILLNPNFTPVNITWDTQISISCTDCLAPTFNPSSTTTYVVSLEDEFGCIIQRSVVVNVKVPDFSMVYIPNVFDVTDQVGGNNLFKPFFHSDATVDFNFMKIYDRWGNLVYSEMDMLNGWDGRSDNNFVTQGVYVYLISYLDSNGVEQNEVGEVMVLR